MSWKKLLSLNPIEFLDQQLVICKGGIPKGLIGSLYRNTVSTKKRRNGYPGHLFDGDGVILKIEFKDEKAIASYKHVQSEGYLNEQQRDEYIYAGLGRTYSGNFLTKIFNSFSFKNPANTSVLPLKNGELLALWEGGLPTSLKKLNLATIGLTNGNSLQNGDTFSAHPKIDSKSGMIYNVGLTHGMNQMVNVYEMNQSGQILRRNSAQVNGRRFMLHDFILAGNYLIAIMYSQFVQDFHKILLGRKALGQDVLNDESQGIQVFVFDKSKNLQLIANKINYFKFNVWHYSNGYVDQNGNVISQAITYPTFELYESFFIENLIKNGLIDSKSSYDRLTINPLTGEILEKKQILNDYIEFPIVHDDDVGSQQEITYALIQQKKDDWFNGIIRIDEINPEKSLRRYYQSEQYLNEAIFVQDNNKSKGEGWLIFVLFDGTLDKSFIEIIDASSLQSVCLLQLPQLIAPSFHGRFEYQI
ncbi:unnamed protein product [Paramecium sonneborni]|uniref:Dioxygenase n=1 Tax=Paramecium sonneborni TaxID=65129 RepID=A0A8S1Q255_9CILI|nr:unnamed protein product [Paramecium sonneborni]